MLAPIQGVLAPVAQELLHGVYWNSAREAIMGDTVDG
jgi:hypothetical protein